MRIGLILLLILIASPNFANQIAIEFLDQGKWKADNSTYLNQGKELVLRTNKDNLSNHRWYLIQPDTNKFYKNANHPWESNPYKWVGFGKINYDRTELMSLRGNSEVEITSSLLEEYGLSSPYNKDTLGSFWFQVEAENSKGEKLSSPGLGQNDYRGISLTVFRASWMQDNSYLGYLTSFYNVPGLFGSIPYQSSNYVGADCADVLMAARGKWLSEELKDYNVAMLVNGRKNLARFDMDAGKPSKKIVWGKDFQPGDFIAVRYSPGRQFAHIGALYKDKNNNGILDKDDLVLHAGPQALHESHLSEGAFDGEVVILANRK